MYILKITRREDPIAFGGTATYTLKLRCAAQDLTEKMQFRIEMDRLVILSHEVRTGNGEWQSVFPTPNARELWYCAISDDSRYGVILDAIADDYVAKKTAAAKPHYEYFFQQLQAGCYDLLQSDGEIALDLWPIAAAAPDLCLEVNSLWVGRNITPSLRFVA